MAESRRWQGWLAWFFPSEMERQARLTQRIVKLTAALKRDPQSAASYVSRGEAHLEAGNADDAAADFRQALALAEAQLKTQTWGVVMQAVRDRALRGLKAAQRSD